MRTVLLALMLVVISGWIQARQDEPKQPAPPGLTIGKDLPAPLNPYNATGPALRRFHDPIGPHGLDPFVLIFTSDTEFMDDTKKLLRDVDTVIDKNPAVRIASCCIFLTPTIKENVVSDDDPREELTEKLGALGKELELKHVILAIDSPNNMPRYEGVLVGTRALVLNKLRLAGQFGGDKWDAKAGSDLDTFLTEKLGAKRRN